MSTDNMNQPQGFSPYEDESESLDLRPYLYLLWDRAWLILLAALVVGTAAYFISRRMTPVYQTTTKLLVSEAASIKTTDYTSLLASEQLTSTYSDMLTNDAVLKEVIKRNGLQISRVDLAKTIKAAPVKDTQLIMVTVEGTNPQEIAQTANTLVQVLTERVNAMQSERYSSSEQNLQAQLKDIEKVMADTQAKINATNDPAEKERLDTQAVQYRQIYANLLTSYETSRLAEAQSSANIMQVNEAEAPLTPIRPRVLVNTLLAVLGAALLVVIVIFSLNALDDTLKTPTQVTNLLGLPVLGVIFEHTNGSGPIAQDEPRSPVSEAFRSLRTNIQYAHIDTPLRSLVITSPSPQEGKTQVSANLATVMAQDGKRVILIDADLRRPSVHKRMNVSNASGMTALLLQPDMDLEQGPVLQKTATLGLSVICSGDLPPNPAELLGSHKMVEVLERLKNEADILVLDTPPVLPVADAAVLAALVDGVLLVLQPGLTTMASARQTIVQLQRVNARIIGVVLNNVELKTSRYSYYYHKGYGYYSSGQRRHSGASTK